MAESNEAIKKILILTNKIYTWWTKKIFNRLVEEKSYEFQNLKEKINPNNLIYKYKTQGRSPKEFIDYQNMIDLFISFRDVNGNLQEVLKNQLEFKSDLGKIRKEIQNQNQKTK